MKPVNRSAPFRRSARRALSRWGPLAIAGLIALVPGGAAAQILTDSCTANPQQVAAGGTTIVTCAAMYSGTCQGQDTTNFAQVDVGTIACDQSCPNETCQTPDPPGTSVGYFTSSSPATCTTSFKITAPASGSGTMHFLDSVNTANACHGDFALQIPFGPVTQECDIHVALTGPASVQVRKGSRAGVQALAENFGAQPCTGTFEFDYQTDAVNVNHGGMEAAGSALSIDCTGTATTGKCVGSGTLQPGQIAGAVGFLSANKDPIQVPWTVKWNTRTSQGLTVVDVLSDRAAGRIPAPSPRRITWAWH